MRIDKEKEIRSRPLSLNGKIILFTLSGAIMIGHGARMIFQAVFNPGTFYSPNTFDLLFDWLTLAILGCFILWFAMTLNYNSKKKSYKKSKDEKIFMHPT